MHVYFYCMEIRAGFYTYPCLHRPILTHIITYIYTHTDNHTLTYIRTCVGELDLHTRTHRHTNADTYLQISAIISSSCHHHISRHVTQQTYISMSPHANLIIMISCQITFSCIVSCNLTNSSQFYLIIITIIVLSLPYHIVLLLDSCPLRSAEHKLAHMLPPSIRNPREDNTVSTCRLSVTYKAWMSLSPKNRFLFCDEISSFFEPSKIKSKIKKDVPFFGYVFHTRERAQKVGNVTLSSLLFVLGFRFKKQP